MGYSYRGNVRCCDNCGQPGGTRKNTCPHRVTYPHENNLTIPYCPPPALCGPCLRTLGGTKAVHSDCKAGADAANARNAEIHRKLMSGDWRVTTAWGDREDTVPTGQVGVRAINAAGDKRFVLIPKADYSQRSSHPFISEFPTVAPWADPQG